MRVVRTGSGSSEKWSRNFVCRECDSTLEIVARDLWVANTAIAYAGETWEPRLAFTCSVCKSTSYLADSAVPSSIRHALYDKARSRRRSS